MNTTINKMALKRFAGKLLIFLLTITIADFITGNVLKKLYFTQRQGADFLATYSIEKTQAPILVLGSSRAVNIIDPQVVKYQLGTTCFNAGRIGQSIFYHYGVLKGILKRYTPETVILCLDAGDFAREQKDYDRLSQLLPYYKTHPEMRDVLQLKGPFEKIKMLSSIYPYNSLLLGIVKGNLGKTSGDANSNGYLPINKKISGPLHKVDYAALAVLDTQKVAAYRSVISECKKAGVQLIVICPPYLVEAKGKDQSLEVAKEIAAANSVFFSDHSTDTAYTNHHEWFADFRHLNKQGAEKFSAAIAQMIRK